MFYNYAFVESIRRHLKLPHFYKEVLIYYTKSGDSKLNIRNPQGDFWNIAEIQVIRHPACLKNQAEKFSLFIAWLTSVWELKYPSHPRLTLLTKFMFGLGVKWALLLLELKASSQNRSRFCWHHKFYVMWVIAKEGF